MDSWHRRADQHLPGSLGSLMTTYSRMMEEMRDPRSDSWLLMDSSWPTVAIVESGVFRTFEQIKTLYSLI